MVANKLKYRSQFVKNILQAPEKAVAQLDLVYISDGSLPITRRKWGRGFTYRINGTTIKEKVQLERIKSLVIPPAWKEVRISDLENGHLQAIGVDDKARKQYIYHPLWSKIRQQTKFYKMVDFGGQLPKIREHTDKDLRKKGWPKEKVIALVIKLMEETHIRIGNEQYAKRNQSYGLSTLRKKHVTVYDDKLVFEFIGKKGKEQQVSLEDKRLIGLVNQCEEIPGWELFKYFDEDGNKQPIESGMVNAYLHDITDGIFTAKDFRTWAASVIYLETAMELGNPEIKKERKQHILTALDTAAEALGNTRAVCRKYYVHPYLIEKYESGALGKSFKNIHKDTATNAFLSATEKEMLRLIKNFQLDLSL